MTPQEPQTAAGRQLLSDLQADFQTVTGGTRTLGPVQGIVRPAIVAIENEARALPASVSAIEEVLAAALHQDCEREWAAKDRMLRKAGVGTWQGTIHMPDAHLDRARSLLAYPALADALAALPPTDPQAPRPEFVEALATALEHVEHKQTGSLDEVCLTPDLHRTHARMVLEHPALAPWSGGSVSYLLTPFPAPTGYWQQPGLAESINKAIADHKAGLSVPFRDDAQSGGSVVHAAGDPPADCFCLDRSLHGADDGCLCCNPVRVTQLEDLAAALHEDCRREWADKAARVPGWQGTQHGEDAHYERALVLIDLLRATPEEPEPRVADRIAELEDSLGDLQAKLAGQATVRHVRRRHLGDWPGCEDSDCARLAAAVSHARSLLGLEPTGPRQAAAATGDER